MNHTKKITAFTITMLISAAAVFAHPHVSIVNKAEFVWKDASLSGVYLEWTFDHFFSSDIISWLDEDKNGQFDARESGLVYNNAFINLENYYYYTFIRQGNKRTNPPKVTQFIARIEKGQMVYRFFIDLSSYPKQDLYLAVYDYTFFSDISYPDTEAVTLNYDKTAVKPKFTIVENKDYPVYYNPLGAADDTRVYYKWEKGLQTYYPKEIKISYE